jgi:hypothetical protein
MAEGCGFGLKIVVWDTEPDINQALGDVYHSQVLVKRDLDGKKVVCLTESQIQMKDGGYETACCTENLALFDGGTIEEFAAAYRGCSALYFPTGVTPHLYEVEQFREKRQTGAMDVPTSYDRTAGARAVQEQWSLPEAGEPAQVRSVHAVYDSQGIAVTLRAE